MSFTFAELWRFIKLRTIDHPARRFCEKQMLIILIRQVSRINKMTELICKSTRQFRRVFPVTLSIFLILLACSDNKDDSITAVPQKKLHSAVIPAQRNPEPDLDWYWPRFETVNERLSQGDVGMLFIGNSITHGWDWGGITYWNRYYKPRKAVNMGFGGDRTQHVLWHLDNLDFSNVSPKLAVVMIGTNNSNGNDNTAEEIADGMMAVCQRLRDLFPDMKILLLAIFPRGQFPDAQRHKCAQASLLASDIADGQMIHYLDLTDHFVSDLGVLSADIMPDYLHPNQEGYRIWAEAMEETIKQLLNEVE